MPRFFVPSVNFSDDGVKICGDDARHIARSLRMAEGDTVTVCDMHGTEHECRLTKIRDEECTCDILSSKQGENEPPVKISLFMAYPKADKLEYSDIANALVRGDFYASEGPEIKELYIEDGKAHIVTSEAVKIVMSTEGRNYCVATPEKVGDTITEATFNVNPYVTDYIRFSVCDKEGKCAYTNAYYLSDLC